MCLPPQIFTDEHFTIARVAFACLCPKILYFVIFYLAQVSALQICRRQHTENIKPQWQETKVTSTPTNNTAAHLFLPKLQRSHGSSAHWHWPFIFSSALYPNSSFCRDWRPDPITEFSSAQCFCKGGGGWNKPSCLKGTPVVWFFCKLNKTFFYIPLCCNRVLKLVGGSWRRN